MSHPAALLAFQTLKSPEDLQTWVETHLTESQQLDYHACMQEINDLLNIRDQGRQKITVLQESGAGQFRLVDQSEMFSSRYMAINIKASPENAFYHIYFLHDKANITHVIWKDTGIIQGELLN